MSKSPMNTDKSIGLATAGLACMIGIAAVVVSCKLPIGRIPPARNAPLAVTLSGVTSNLSLGETMTVTPSVTGYTGNLTYSFSLNGTAEATKTASSPSWTFGSNLSAGQYRISVTALSADGARSGSAAASFSVTGASATVHLKWNPSTSTEVAGYKVLYGQTSGSYAAAVDAGTATSATVGGLIPGHTYYFVTIAYTATGAESSSSNEVAYTVPTP